MQQYDAARTRGLFNPHPVRFDGDHEPITGDWLRMRIEEIYRVATDGMGDCSPSAMAALFGVWPHLAAPSLVFEAHGKQTPDYAVMDARYVAHPPAFAIRQGSKLDPRSPAVYTREFLVTGGRVYYSSCCFIQVSGIRLRTSLGQGWEGDIAEDTLRELTFLHEGVALAYLQINRLLLAQPAAATYRRTRSRLPAPRRLSGRPTLPGKIRIMDFGGADTVCQQLAALPPLSPAPAAERERHCPAWGVRGHWRHYRSGKTVFVRAHVRGPDKSQYHGREYEISERAVQGESRK